MGKTSYKAKSSGHEKKEEVREENYPGKLIIEWSERNHSPFGEYRLRWDKGIYQERTYSEFRKEEGFYVLYYNGSYFAVLKKEEKEIAERKLYDKIVEAAKKQIELVGGVLKRRGIILEDRTKYAEKK